MKGVYGHILLFFLAAVACAWSMTSCTDDTYDAGSGNDDVLLIFHISPLQTRGGDDSASCPNERVKTLRAIIMGENEGEWTIEYNYLFDILSNTGSNVDAKDETQWKHISKFFNYKTKAGRKRFYFFANEESTGPLSFSSGTELPAELRDKGALTLKELLSYYTADVTIDEEGQAIISPSPKGNNFTEVINSVYFSPTYHVDVNNDIFLPYTAYYTKYDAQTKDVGYEIAQKKLDNETGVQMPQMYLVPVATKFSFQFVNYRPAPVVVDEITVFKKNTENFLLAQVGENDLMKSFPTEEASGNNAPTYWIDWLAEVAKKSHEHTTSDSNASFNEKYGWISDYSMPNENDTTEATLIAPSDSNQHKTVEAKTKDADGTDIPGELLLGPYYLPESRHMYTYKKPVVDNDGKLTEDTKEVTEQGYFLTLGLKDQSDPNNKADFEKVAIENLHSLFRNTSVLIKATLRGSADLEIYAEIAEWTNKTTNGSVTENPSGPKPQNP